MSASRPANTSVSSKPVSGLHPRNPHQGRYDFAALQRCSPLLTPFVITSPRGEPTIDFADAQAVKALNRALLMQHYALEYWDIPEGFLCPPIPGRADHIHHLADLLADAHGGKAPQGKKVQVLDIGTGANLIYPILASQSYGWQCVGADISQPALASAQRIIEANPVLQGRLSLRRQPAAQQIFTGIVRPGEQFDLSLCNPPFHASAQEAGAGTARKLRNLAQHRQQRGGPAAKQAGRDRLNFGGQHAELWCPGGEAAFVARMIEQSKQHAQQLCWFSSLIANGRHLPALQKQLRRIGAADVEVLTMQQGQKQSRILAWSFLDCKMRKFWAQHRWG